MEPRLPGHKLATVIWPALSPAEYQSMRKQYVRLCDYFDREMAVLGENADSFAFSSDSDIASLIGALMAIEGEISRSDALNTARALTGASPSEDRLMRSVDIAVRIWLTLDVSSLDLRRPGLLAWPAKQSLTNVIESHFNKLEQEECRTSGSDENIDPDLKADYLVSYHGYTIVWTDNLASHLTIDWKHKTLTIYEHKISLHNHLRLAGSSPSPVPRDVLGEAIDTLNLLFPFQDDGTKRLLIKHKRPFYGLGMCNRTRKLKLSDYSYWRSRVADLIYISSGPAVGIRQLKLSRKGDNLLQFATFWIATAVGVLTLVSIAIGVAATVYSAKQYELSLKQYDISILQLCVDPEARKSLRVCEGAEKLGLR
ncbi:hypothetical protein QBC34DRAFT_413341 [Podospora aff. communis PSN243]|uniref:Uncharacterized protein n=1 Tax=Podospora aff. communis PSN243 TaxID=3040156 RepID=A0AAV9GB63_9PEZI|nr:hypothetical protein QBC34DRAFT_413341 [Podospora aff. communis PSN243]